MSDDTIDVGFVHDRYALRPIKHNYEGNPSVSARFPPEEFARLEAFCRRVGRDRTAVVRQGVTLLVSGYPALPPDLHDWLLRLAARNDMGPDPQTALVALLSHLAHRYPAAGRLPS